jgi:tetratricopeptide (TPR) repeat protein
VLALRERQLGVKHAKTLASRNNLAAVLQEQGRHAEAEREHRTVLELRQKVLGARHPDVFLSCFNLGLCLEAQSRLDEALPCMRRAQTGFQKLLGANHPHAQFAAESVQRIEAEMKP